MLQPSTFDLFDEWTEVRDISELNLVMGIGTQTQKLIDYCSTPIQLTGVPCDDGASEASKKNKKVLLKNMDRNINKYIDLVMQMNKIVTDAKEKYFWDPYIMRMCKRWDDTVKDTVSTADHRTCDSDEVLLNEDVEDAANIQEFGGDKDATVQKENTEKTKTKGCDDDEIVIEEDGGISDTCLAKLQTVEPGVYRHPDQTREGNKFDHYYSSYCLLTDEIYHTNSD
ncbi:hypothetical protein Hanom_Chr11g00975471 [Helianthus anomalus]